MVDKPIDPLEQRLRRTLHTHLDPLTANEATKPVSHEARAIQARMRAQTMQRIPIQLVGVAAAILLVLALLAGIPYLLPEQQPPLQPSQIPPPAETGTPGPSPTPASPSLTPTPAVSNPAAPGRLLYRAPANGGTGLFLTDENGANPVDLTHQDNESSAGTFIPSFTWSPDGEWIAYSRSANGQEEIFIMNSSGGQVTQLTNTPGMLWRELAWSSRGEWIAAIGARTDHPEDTWLYVAPVNGGGTHKVYNWEGARFPAWSPVKNEYLLFSVPEHLGAPAMMIRDVTQLNSLIEILPPESSGPRPGRDGPYTWSPDGALAYIEQTPMQGDGTFAANAVARLLVRAAENLLDTTVVPTVLVDNLPIDTVQSIRWSPDGKTIAMTVADGQQGCLSLQLVDMVQAGQVVKIPEFCLAEGSAPEWTRDGRLVMLDGGGQNGSAPRLVILSVAETMANPGSEHFFTLPINSAAQDVKIQPWGGSLGLKPAPAPAQPAALLPSPLLEAPGTLWFSTADLGPQAEARKYRVYSSRPDGSLTSLVTEIGLYGITGSLSPDGAQVAFASWGNEFPTLVIAPLDGKTAPQSLKEISPAAGPAWSPDGKQMVLFALNDSNQGVLDQLKLVDLSSGQPGIRTLPLGGITSPHTPKWSPDGRTIALPISMTKPGEYWPYLYLLDPQNSTEAQSALTSLTQTEDGRVIDLAWSPDGQQIAFLSHDLDFQYTELRLVHADGTEKRTLARPAFLNPMAMSNTYLAWSPDGRYLSFVSYEVADGLAMETHITLADVQSGETYLLPKASDENITGTAWSPDGRWLAYKSDQGVFVMDVPAALSGTHAPVRVSDLTNLDLLAWRP